jgi:glycosyltransferase involved in cell wall biosynthesis
VIPDSETVVIDGLLAGAIGTLIKEHAERLTIVSLIHLPLSVSPWNGEGINRHLLNSERTALNSSHVIVVTSEFARSSLLQSPYDCRKEKISVIEPGRHKTPRKKSYRELPRRLLCVANIIQRKGYVTLLEALVNLTDIEWVLTCCGSEEYETSYVRHVRDMIRDCGLEDRIIIKGPISGEELGSEYLGADLFVFPSCYETYGMALTEAAGYGLPIVTSIDPTTNKDLSGNAVVFFRPDQVITLQEILRELMTNPVCYAELCEGAKMHVPATRSWTECAEIFLKLLISKSRKETAF